MMSTHRRFLAFFVVLLVCAGPPGAAGAADGPVDPKVDACAQCRAKVAVDTERVAIEGALAETGQPSIAATADILKPISDLALDMNSFAQPSVATPGVQPLATVLQPIATAAASFAAAMTKATSFLGKLVSDFLSSISGGLLGGGGSNNLIGQMKGVIQCTGYKDFTSLNQIMGGTFDINADIPGLDCAAGTFGTGEPAGGDPCASACAGLVPPPPDAPCDASNCGAAHCKPVQGVSGKACPSLGCNPDEAGMACVKA